MFSLYEWSHLPPMLWQQESQSLPGEGQREWVYGQERGYRQRFFGMWRTRGIAPRMSSVRRLFIIEMMWVLWQVGFQIYFILAYLGFTLMSKSLHRFDYQLNRLQVKLIKSPCYLNKINWMYKPKQQTKHEKFKLRLKLKIVLQTHTSTHTRTSTQTMQQKTHRPLFQQAISAVRKQVDSNPPTNPKKPEQNQNNNPANTQYEDMSSGEQQRLKELGVDLGKTKRIAKDYGGSQDKRDGNQRRGAEKEWRHDKYRAHQQSSSSKATSSYKPRPSTSHNSTQLSKPAPSFLIKFPTIQQYSKIYQLVKSQKAFISEIDEHHIKFTKQFAWNTCKKILKGEGVQFDDGTGGLDAGDNAKGNTQKESIFSRLK